jgi:hypothetical protein
METIKLSCFYIIGMKLNAKLLFAAPIVLLIMGATSNSVYAWDCGWGSCGGGEIGQSYGGRRI